MEGRGGDSETMDKKRKRGGLYAIVVAVVVAAIMFGLSIHPGSTTLAAAVEEYIGGLEVGGTSYEVVQQTENEAEVIVYLEIIENGQTQRVPKENLLLVKDDIGNWGVVSATAIVKPDEQSEESAEQSPEEQEPRPAELSVIWVEQPFECVKMEPVMFVIHVVNDGDMHGTYTTEVLADGTLVENVIIPVDGRGDNRTTVTITFDKIGEYAISAAGKEWTITVHGIKEWWNDPVISASVRQVIDDYMWWYVFEEIPGVARLYKGEPWSGYGWDPYDREGDVVVLEGWITYGEVPNIKVDYWLAKIDLDTYQVVEFYEIAE